MDEHINRKGSIEFIRERQCHRCSEIGSCGGCAVLLAMKLLEEVPAADVVLSEEYTKLQAENTQLKNKVWSLRKKIREMKSDASWEEDTRRGQVQGMW